jgi:acyl-CoA synthetase (AMP-forming)/AMP-acid ligase II
MSEDRGDRPRVIGELTARNAAARPGQEAVVDGARRMSWTDFDDRVTRLANALLDEMGLEPGDRIAFLGENCLEGFELLYGGPMVGVIVVPLNDRLADKELAGVLAAIEPKVLFHTAAAAERAALLTGSAEAMMVTVGHADHAAYDALLAAAGTSRPDVRVEPDDVSSICFTSGTTGRPKGVMMTHRAQLAFARAQTVIEPVSSDSRHLFARQLAVAPGHRIAAWHGLNGGCTIITPRFVPSDFFRVVEEERVTNVLLAPTQLQMLLDDGNPAGHDLATLRTIVYGGAPTTPTLLAATMEFFSCDLLQAYGGTEAGQILYVSRYDHHAGRVGAYHNVVPGVEIERRSEDGRVVGDDEPGQIHVHSEQLMAGYWRDPDKTAAVLHDGWYATGDLSIVDADGGIQVAGRTSDMIISGGYNIMPIEIEDLIREHLAVRDVAVFGVPDELWGEAVHAAVVVGDAHDLDVDELGELCASQLAAFKTPKAIHLVDQLPLTLLGKVDKASLRREWTT